MAADEPKKKPARRRRTISLTLDDATFAAIRAHQAAVPATADNDSAAIRDLVRIAAAKLKYRA